MSSLPQVGLEAIIAGMPGFNAGAAAIISAYDAIEKKGENVAKASSILGSSISAVSAPFVNLGQDVMKFGAIAGGVALAGVVALGAGITALGVSAVEEFAKYERMSLSIQNLVAREISQGQVVEQQIQTRIGLTQKETEELSKLPQKITDETLSRQTLAAQIQEQQQKIIQLTAAYGDNGLNVQVAKARLAEMENEYVKSGTEIDTLNGRITELNSKNNDLTTTLQKVRVGQMSMSDAMQQAGPRAQELLKWIQLLAIQSPFTQEGVAVAFQTALTYGFTTQQAQRLTQAMIDFTSATGKGESVMNDVAYALGQIEARGKVTQHELRMLGTAGIGVNRILEDMGMSLDDVTAGNVNADKFIEAVTKDMEIFTGAGKQQATTFSGLFSTLSDIKSIGLREFFTGTFKAIQPYLANFANTLSDMIFQTGSIRSLGDALGQSVGNALATISNLVAQFQRWGPEGIFAAMGFSSSSLFIASVKTLFDLIAGQLPSAQSMFEGFSSTISYLQANLFPMLTQAVSFVIDHFIEFKGALIGIGAVLGAGVFAALVAGLVSLLSPINLIIAAAALLGAAWAGNWGDIQGKTFAAWAVIQPVLTEIVTWLQANIPIAIQTASNFWTSTLQPAMVQVSGWITGTLIPILTNIWTWLSTSIPNAIQTVSDYWTGTLQPALKIVGDYINNTLVPFWQSVGDVLGAVVNKAVEAGAGLWQNVLYPALTAVGDYLSATLGPIFKDIGDFLVVTFGPTLQQLGDSFLPKVTGGFSGITSAIQDATTWLNDLAGKINSLQLPPWLTPGSPTPFELGLLGIAAALQGPVTTSLSIFSELVSTSLATIQASWLSLELSVNNLIVALPVLTTLFTVLFTTWLVEIPLMLQQVILLDAAIQSIYLLTFPIFTTTFLEFVALWLQQHILMQQQVTMLDMTIQSIYLITLPTLRTSLIATGTTTTTVSQLMVTAIQSVISIIGQLIVSFTNLGSVATRIGSEIKNKMNDAAKGVENLTEAVQEAIEAFEDMEKAARAAAEAAASAGRASGAAGGIGFHSGIGFAKGTPLSTNLKSTGGTLGLGATIPPGYPNDSFGPMYVQSGEQMLITPKGLSIEELISQRLSSIVENINTPVVQTPTIGTSSTTNNTVNNFQMTVNSGASPQAVIQTFNIAKAMLT